VTSPPDSSFAEVLPTLDLDRTDATTFRGRQLPAPANHILGGHISAQALLAASLTAPGRVPHSVHTYFLRPGDAREPVDFEVVDLQEGRTFSARRVTARQSGQVLLEAMSSFKVPGTDPEALQYQPAMPDAPNPDAVPEVPWAVPVASLRWFHRRVAQEPSREDPRSRIWWRPAGEVPADPVLTAALVAYLSAVTLTEPAFAARGGLAASAQRDHSVWFHGPADLSDWLFYDQVSPSGADSLALCRGTMFNRDGGLVCTVGQEMYFPPPRR
jgi:acyl-CoA thioesterase II